MKVKTIIENRFPIRKVKVLDRLILALSLVAETGMNTMLPFAFGFYFATTGRLIFILMFMLNIMFHIKITKKYRGGIEIRITRGI
jgi:uncharacterized membrane protein